MFFNSTSSLAYVYGKPRVTGILKQTFEDFQVTENLSFTPSGDGEHVFLKIIKTNLNTLDVCQRISRHFNVHPRNVSYAGLKDKRAVTTQWFSFPFPVKSVVDLDGFESDGLKVKECTRNTRKLKRGAIQSNYFKITLRQLDGSIDEIDDKVNLIRQKGVANYFGAQRFGHNESNLVNAVKMFSGKIRCNRNKRSLYLSAIRSYLFNEVLSQRIKENAWDELCLGDVAVLNNSRSYFIVDELTDDLLQRFKKGDIHPSAPLWGEGELCSMYSIKNLEEKIIAAYPQLMEGLIQSGLQQDRRSIRLVMPDLTYQTLESELFVEFTLPSGSYATSVLREIVDFSEQ